MSDRSFGKLVGLGSLFVGGAMLVIALSHCKPACTVIDTAADVCTIVRYVDDAGSHSVTMPAEDMAAFGRLETEMAAARAARASDAGAADVVADGGGHD